MKTLCKFIFTVVLLNSIFFSQVHAQTGKTHTFPPINSSALEKFGGEAGIRIWVESLFHFIMLDNRINHVFMEYGNIERQIYLNTQLEMMVLGGGNEYQGASMKAAHADLNITLTQFNAVVEAAYLACERNSIKYSICNQLIAGLAPYKHDIVTK